MKTGPQVVSGRLWHQARHPMVACAGYSLFLSEPKYSTVRFRHSKRGEGLELLALRISVDTFNAKISRRQVAAPAVILGPAFKLRGGRDPLEGYPRQLP